MKEQNEGAQKTTHSVSKHKRRKGWQMLAGVAAAVLIFVLGVNVGNGRISVGMGNDTTQLPARLDYSSVNEVYDLLKKNYYQELKADELTDGMKRGLAQATGDPYTQYFNAKEAEEFNQELSNSFSGIGAQLGKDEDGNLEVIAPVKGTPADRAGLRARDIIATVNDESTENMSVDQAVSKIRGKAGTKVKLGIVRDKREPLTLEITREEFTVPSVETEVVDGVGIMTINSFAPDTAELADKAATAFKEQGLRKIVLDLRNNPGGEVDAAVATASLWLDPGTRILQEKRGNVVLETENASGNPTLKGIPTVVLINQGSASASEIVAGALKDNKAATVIGEKSYGKGVVQGLESLRGGAQLKVTIASWYRPNGQNIDKKGIEPDQKVERTADDIKAERDPQLDAAKAQLNK